VGAIAVRIETIAHQPRDIKPSSLFWLDQGALLIINEHNYVHQLMLPYEITSPTEARNGFFQLLEQVVQNHQIYIINRRDGENVALISESDLTSLVETVYLFRSPANARRLLDAIEESKAGKIKPQTIEELEQELGIEQEKEKEI
jgi:antitoxin YefM